MAPFRSLLTAATSVFRKTTPLQVVHPLKQIGASVTQTEMYHLSHCRFSVQRVDVIALPAAQENTWHLMMKKELETTLIRYPQVLPGRHQPRVADLIVNNLLAHLADGKSFSEAIESSVLSPLFDYSHKKDDACPSFKELEAALKNTLYQFKEQSEEVLKAPRSIINQLG